MEVSRPSASGSTPVQRVRILHTNDVHGNLSPLPDQVILGRPALLGGSACLATVVEKAREEDPGRTLLLDSGDSVHGNLSTDIDRGKGMVRVMDRLGYDAGTIGNHDFQWGVDRLIHRLGTADYRVLVSNVVMEDGSPLPRTEPRRIFDMDGVKVGVTGLLTTETARKQRKHRIEGVKFLDEVTTLRENARALREEGADVVVVMSHMGLAKDREVASQLAGEGLIFLGGHSHDRVPEAQQVAGNYVVQAGSMGKEVGELVLEVQGHQVVGVQHRLIPLDPATLEPEPHIAALVSRYENRAEWEMGFPLTILSEALTRSDRHDSTLGNFVTDSMRSAAGAQLAFLNSDALRADLRPGIVRKKELYALMPFEGEVMRGELKGSQVLEALEHSVQLRGRSPETQSSFLQVSGLRFAYDASRPEGQRVLEVEVDGRPLDPEATYTVALDDYLYEGRLGYTSFADGKWKATGVAMMDAMAAVAKGGIPAGGSRRIEDRTPAAAGPDAVA